MNYNNNNIDDLLINDSFIDWVLSPDDENTNIWEKWMAENPDKIEIVKEAKAIIVGINKIENSTNVQHNTEKNWDAIKAKTIGKEQTISNSKTWILWSSSILLVVLLGWFIYEKFIPKNSNATVVVAQNNLIQWIVLKNTEAVSKTINLHDGSIVTLEPYSLLKYPTIFNTAKREVFLEGEAFFDIAHNKDKPFLVYANETITKVLGTSFRIKAFDGNKNVEVSVKTGKVAVYAKVDNGKEEKKQPQKLVVQADKEVLLPLPNAKLEITPNQKVIFDKVNEGLIKTIMESPEIIRPIETLPKFDFKNEPISDFFKALAKVYDLEIMFNEIKLKDCTITGTLTDEPLFDKLAIICMALELTYEEKDGIIHIDGNGC